MIIKTMINDLVCQNAKIKYSDKIYYFLEKEIVYNNKSDSIEMIESKSRRLKQMIKYCIDRENALSVMNGLGEVVGFICWEDDHIMHFKIQKDNIKAIAILNYMFIHGSINNTKPIYATMFKNEDIKMFGKNTELKIGNTYRVFINVEKQIDRMFEALKCIKVEVDE